MRKKDAKVLNILLILSALHSALSDILPSCTYPPCRYNVYRDDDDDSNIVVDDSSSHTISWNWDVRGGKWNVTYRYNYPAGWYEGTVTFINCSNVLNGREQPFVSWGSSKNWESNALLIYATPWNITYNGEVFGFIPTGEGKYIFRVFTKNKRHNPFRSEELILPPDSCNFQSSDKAQIKMWWADIKRLKNCPEAVFTWNWSTNGGKWRVNYKWLAETDRISSSVFYTGFQKNEVNLINWEVDVPHNLVAYKTNPIRINDEPAWNIDLSPMEVWGFSPKDKGRWIFQHFSRNLVFQPFMN